MYSCRVCEKKSVTVTLDCGEQAISNRFMPDINDDEFKHSLQFGVCSCCGLAQLVNPVKSNFIVKPYDWLKYNEPEGHLDDLVSKILNLPGINTSSSFCGISGFEASTLARINNNGYLNTWQLDIKNDLAINDKFASVETIQEILNIDKAEHIITNHGATDVVIARYILEHAHQPLKFIAALKKMVSPNGYLVFEVPESTRQFETYDYSILWEEHVAYFTYHTLIYCIKLSGLQIHTVYVNKTPMEDSLIIIAKAFSDDNQTNNVNMDEAILKSEVDRIDLYSRMFENQANNYREILLGYACKGKIALLGAGHLACRFLNNLNLSKLIDYVIDDNPQKNGMYMPGTKHKISKTDILDNEGIALCLLSLNYTSEQKLLSNKKDFIEKGGSFRSIFPTSDFALEKDNSDAMVKAK